MRYLAVLIALTLSLNANVLYPIESLLSEYKRPVTVLLLTKLDAEAYKTIRSRPRDCFVLWDHTFKIKKDHPTNLIVLSRKMSHHDLLVLSESEHFDIGLVTSHQLPMSKSYFKILKSIALRTYLNVNEDTRIQKLLSQTGFERIGENWYHITTKKPFNRRTMFLMDGSDQNRCREIVSTYTEKTLCKKYGSTPTTSKWLPGINLMTFKMLNGSFPTTKQLESEIRRIFETDHNDWMPNNMVVQGNHIELIDFADPHGNTLRSIKSDRLLDLTLKLATTQKPCEIPYYLDLLNDYNAEMIHNIQKH